jgi:exodeoxyribonuclease-3
MPEVLKIATWNINSVRIRVQQLALWLQRNNIDIVLLQELKCQNEQFPFDDFETLGYNCYVSGQKSYNGVAILSKFPADEINISFDDNPCPDEARFIEIALKLPIGYSRIASVYVPNGGEVLSDKYEKKLLFLDALNKYLQKISYDEHYIIGGDYNVAVDDIDVYSPEDMENSTCFTQIERQKIRKIKNSGLLDPADFIEQKNRFTWWDYRAGCFQNNKGLRIDYFLMGAKAIDLFKDLKVDIDARREEKSSDHAPVILAF